MISAGNIFATAYGNTPTCIQDTVPANATIKASAVAANIPVGTTDSIASYGVTATDMFGAQSFIPETIIPQPIADHVSLTDNITYQIIVVVLMIFYVYAVINSRTATGEFISNLRSRKNDEHNQIISRFTTILHIVGFLAAGVSSIKLLDLWFPQAGDVMAGWVIRLLPIMIGVGYYVLFFIQYYLLKAITDTTFNKPLFASIVTLKNSFFGLFCIAATPLTLLMALSSGTLTEIIAYVLAGMTFAIAIAYIFRSFMVFVSQKLSILFWFLYLCTLEIMPFGIILVSLYRSL